MNLKSELILVLYMQRKEISIQSKGGWMLSYGFVSGAYLFQNTLHNLRAVVDSQNDIRNTNSGERLNLVQNHGLVGELDQRLGHSESL